MTYSPEPYTGPVERGEGIEAQYTFPDEEDDEVDPDDILVDDVPFETYLDDFDLAMVSGEIDISVPEDV